MYRWIVEIATKKKNNRKQKIGNMTYRKEQKKTRQINLFRSRRIPRHCPIFDTSPSTTWFCKLFSTCIRDISDLTCSVKPFKKKFFSLSFLNEIHIKNQGKSQLIFVRTRVIYYSFIKVRYPIEALSIILIIHMFLQQVIVTRTKIVNKLNFVSELSVTISCVN